MARASLAALLFLFVACSDDGPMTETCIPGASVACTCPDGTMGAQVCTAEGTFNPCSCSPGADAGAVDKRGATAASLGRTPVAWAS